MRRHRRRRSGPRAATPAASSSLRKANAREQVAYLVHPYDPDTLTATVAFDPDRRCARPLHPLLGRASSPRPTSSAAARSIRPQVCPLPSRLDPRSAGTSSAPPASGWHRAALPRGPPPSHAAWRRGLRPPTALADPAPQRARMHSRPSISPLTGEHPMTHRIAILGASGYTGAELVRLIATHPSMQIVALSADRKAGMAMAEVFPFLRHLDLPTLQKIDEIDFSGVDLVLLRAAPCDDAGGGREAAARPEDRRPVRRFPPARPGGIREVVRPAPRRARPAEGGGLRADRVLPATRSRRARLVAGTGCNAATGQFALRPADRGRGDRPGRDPDRPQGRRVAGRGGR